MVSDSWDRYRALADKSRATPATQSPYGPASFTEGWAILLETFDGSKQDTRAAQLVKRLRHDLSLPDVWIRQIDNKTSVMRGHYFDASDEAARSDLRQTRMLVLDGTRPYESVELVPLSESARGGTGSMDLRQFAGKGLYTLQVAAFDEAYGKELEKQERKEREAHREAKKKQQEEGLPKPTKEEKVAVAVANLDGTLAEVRAKMAERQLDSTERLNL